MIESLLTEQQVSEIVRDFGAGEGSDNEYEVARATERVVLQSPEIQKMKVDRDVLRGAVRILSFAIEEISEDAGVDLNRTMICLLDAETGEETRNPVPARRFIDGFRQVYGAKT